jgi:hypothetical protein
MDKEVNINSLQYSTHSGKNKDLQDLSEVGTSTG